MTRILLVEDEENYREPLALNLRRDGFEVVEAADGTQAVERFEAAGGPGGPQRPHQPYRGSLTPCSTTCCTRPS